MKNFSKRDHTRAILEFYKAGYITTIEKDELIACIYKAYYCGAFSLKASTNVEGRELLYIYAYTNSKQLVDLYVKGDFCIEYRVEKGIFNVIDITKQ